MFKILSHSFVFTWDTKPHIEIWVIHCSFWTWKLKPYFCLLTWAHYTHQHIRNTWVLTRKHQVHLKIWVPPALSHGNFSCTSRFQMKTWVEHRNMSDTCVWPWKLELHMRFYMKTWAAHRNLSHTCVFVHGNLWLNMHFNIERWFCITFWHQILSCASKYESHIRFNIENWRRVRFNTENW